MDEQTQIEDLSIRLRRLEQLHIYGASILAIAVIYLLIKKKNDR